MDAKQFSFADLEKRIAALPDGPMGALNRPRWQYWLDLLGGVGVILGLLPSALIQFMAPALWMVTMAWMGFWVMVLAFLPGVSRETWVMMRMWRRGKAQDAEQLDHDFDQMDGLQPWLSKLPRSALERRLRFIQMAQARVAAKLSLMGGGLERFGVLPLILAVVVQIKAITAESLALPLWQIVPGMFFAIVYVVGLNAAFYRVRMHLYEVTLAEALARREPGK